MNKKILVCLMVIVLAAIAAVGWKKTHAPLQSPQPIGVSIPSDWKEYRNTDLHFSFSYPPKLGNVTATWDTYPGITGNEFSGIIATKSEPNNPQFIFGSSSLDYNGNYVEARSTGFSDRIQTLEAFTSDEFHTVVPIESGGAQGKLLIGIGKCDGIGYLPDCTNDPLHPAYLAVFSLPENTRGLKVIGLETFSESKDEFLKILSTFKQI